MNNNQHIIGFFFLIIISFSLMGCNDIKINSKWKTQEITIDGKNTEWQSGHYIKDANVVVNVYNDEEYLYLALLSSDRQMPMKVMGGGLTVWFDPDGEGGKKLGIHYPLGMGNMEMPSSNMNPSDNDDRNNRKLKDMDISLFNEYEVLGKDGNVKREFRCLIKKVYRLKLATSRKSFYTR